jgi:frataxin-like iron-binding protein CyaY
MSVHMDENSIMLKVSTDSSIWVIERPQGFSFEVAEGNHWAWTTLGTEEAEILAKWLNSRIGVKE